MPLAEFAIGAVSWKRNPAGAAKHFRTWVQAQRENNRGCFVVSVQHGAIHITAKQGLN